MNKPASAVPARFKHAGAGHEIEIKLAAPDVAAVARRLVDLGAARGPRVHEVNAVFDTPDSRMRSRGQLLRLRVERRVSRRSRHTGLNAREKAAVGTPRARLARVAEMLFPPRGGGRALVTLKAPVAHAPEGRRRQGPQERRRAAAYKIRREIEFAIPDAGALRAVLAYLGYHPVFFYEKFRTTYRLPGRKDVVVALDETPIGTYLELEGRPREIDRARRLLGYEAREAILASYGALYAAQQRARHLPFRHMLFE